jgi:hypothetical protein
LYNSVEEEEDPTISPDSGSESYLSQNKEKELRRLHKAFKDDFDDPTTILHSTPMPNPTSSLSSFQYDDLDMDDPISANGLRRINSNQPKGRKRLEKTRTSSLGESAISLPSTDKQKNNPSVRARVGSTGTAYNNYASNSNIIRTVRNPQSPYMNNKGVHLNGSSKISSTKNNNNNSSINSSSSISSNANKSTRGSSKKLSRSTMIDSPLHLDPIT